eukprot:1022375-Pleurochrysis_carterae.AAC.1
MCEWTGLRLIQSIVLIKRAFTNQYIVQSVCNPTNIITASVRLMDKALDAGVKLGLLDEAVK